MDKSIYSPRSVLLAATLKRLRDARGMTMKDVAANIGRGHSYVSDYESGQRRLDMVQLTEVAVALGSTLTAIAETVAGQPSASAGAPQTVPAFADEDEPNPPPSLGFDHTARNAWYQAEWSRLCLLLKGTRENLRNVDGKPLTQEGVAERLGVPQSFVSKYEGMKRRLDLIEFEQVALALETTAVALARTFEDGVRPYSAT